MTARPNIIDVDFALQPEYVLGDTSPAIFGHGQAPGLCASFADEAEVIPESDWQDIAAAIQQRGTGNSALVTRIFNQKQEGSCVANATSQSNQIIQAQQFGKERVIQLSAISLYKRIGRSPNSGAMVSDGLKEMSSRGILPLDTPENKARFKHTMPATGFYEDFPDGWEETAGMFKSLEWIVIDRVEELVSALLMRWPVVVGREGHSICYCDYLPDGRVKYANSWGDWGENGFGYDTIKKIKSSSRWAFAPRSVTVPTFQLA